MKKKKTAWVVVDEDGDTNAVCVDDRAACEELARLRGHKIVEGTITYEI